MNTSLESVGTVTVVELLGDVLDAVVSEDLKNHLRDLAADRPNLVVDLHRITFVDSSGCGALIAAQRTCKEAGGDLRLCRLAGQVKTVFDLARLTRVLGVHDTRAEAVAAFGG